MDPAMSHLLPVAAFLLLPRWRIEVVEVVEADVDAAGASAGLARVLLLILRPRPPRASLVALAPMIFLLVMLHPRLGLAVA